MEIKALVISAYAIQTVKNEFEYLKEKISDGYAYKFREQFFQKAENILPFYLSFPECRFLPTKNKIYRNVIWDNYFLIYKILGNEILVLGIFHTSQNPSKVKAFRRVKKGN